MVALLLTLMGNARRALDESVLVRHKHNLQATDGTEECVIALQVQLCRIVWINRSDVVQCSSSHGVSADVGLKHLYTLCDPLTVERDRNLVRRPMGSRHCCRLCTESVLNESNEFLIEYPTLISRYRPARHLFLPLRDASDTVLLTTILHPPRHASF